MRSNPEAKRTFGSALVPNATSQVRGPVVIVPLETRTMGRAVGINVQIAPSPMRGRAVSR
jgi:hypothetical protein